MFLNIPDDMCREIYSRLSYKDQQKIACTFKLEQNSIYYKLFQKFINNIVKIQRFYKRNLPRLPPDNHYDPSYSRKYTKKLLVRHYIAHYPMERLIIYPEHLINNCRYRNDTEELMNWLIENTPHNITDRKPKHIRKFLMLPQIIKRDIMYAGW